jgi:hypothetical protein
MELSMECTVCMNVFIIEACSIPLLSSMLVQ